MITTEDKYVVVLFDGSMFYYALVDTEEAAINYRVFGDFAGYSKITLTYPKKEQHD